MASSRILPFLVLTLLAACQLPSADPPADLPSLSLTPASSTISAGDAPITFVATVQNSAEAVTWVYAGAGSITPETGPLTSYTPPSSIASAQSGSLTATLGSTGVSATAAIVIYPAGAAPPSAPTDPTTPTDPTDAADPTNPTDPPDPTNPPEPTDSSNPTEPTNPTDPAPAMKVVIAAVDPVTLAAGQATAALKATVQNAPSSTVSYEWMGEGGPDSIEFSSLTTQAVVVTFKTPGTYPFRVTASSGSATASATVNVTVAAAQTVQGIWDAPAASLGAFSLELTQNGRDVSGSWTFYDSDYPVSGTFDGASLVLSTTFAGTPLVFDATVAGDVMSGAISNPSTSYPSSATRQVVPELQSGGLSKTKLVAEDSASYAIKRNHGVSSP